MVQCMPSANSSMPPVGTFAVVALLPLPLRSCCSVLHVCGVFVPTHKHVNTTCSLLQVHHLCHHHGKHLLVCCKLLGNPPWVHKPLVHTKQQTTMSSWGEGHSWQHGGGLSCFVAKLVVSGRVVACPS